VFAALAGCSSARSQVAQVQAEKEQLISAIREQKKELEEIKARNEKLTAQLNEAEIEIARGPSFDERRLAAKSLEKPSTSPSGSGPSAMEQLLVDKTLGKKSPGDVASSANKPADKAVASSPSKMLSVPVPSEVDSKLPWKPSRNDSTTGLQQWAAQREWLRFDQASQSVVVNAPLKFKADGRTLADDSKKTLDELAALLKSGDGKSLRVMVADESARTGTSGAVQLSGTPAHAIAEHLDRSGIASERLGMAAVPSEGNTDGSPRLSLYILPGETPIIGWTPPADKVRR
jgi:outer membrane protein OmpA-like peptidoglycan-associated protein